MLTNAIFDLPDGFSESLETYCDQARAAIEARKHHDQRRALFMNFLRKTFGIEVEDIELEDKVTGAIARGLIDALYRYVIFEFKTNLEAERPKAIEELKKYFETKKVPEQYVGVVTDCLTFEVYDYDPKTTQPELVRRFRLEAESPHAGYLELDELLKVGAKIPPSSENIVNRFGPRCMTFNRSRRALRSAFDAVRNLPSVATKFREWNSLLAKVYGSSPDDEDLFIKHTYLTMVSRAIAATVLYPKVARDVKMRRGLMNSEFFRNRNIQNLAEPDFFSWALETEAERTFFEFFGNLFRSLGEFEWSRLDEDLLKMLYQELVDPPDRQLLGEFYTPDWLAELTLEKIQYTEGTLLDPACGSGTFLFCAIRRLRAGGFKGNKLVRKALESVIGIDVHPVATLMAKANIRLAMAEEVQQYPDEITLRVYLADTLMSGEDKEKRALRVQVSEKENFFIPLESLERGRDLVYLVDRMVQFAHRGASSKEAEASAKKGFAKLLDDYGSYELFHWQENVDLMMRVVKDGRNTVWGFILKNAYRPAYLRQQKVDFVVANPPWLSLRDIQDAVYKEKVKSLAFRYKLLEKKDRKLFTQLDTSTVFFAHSEQEFLREGGTLAFVMPKSVILPAKQHLAFQKTGFTAIHDFGEVDGLFKVPTCVLIKGGNVSQEKIPITHWRGDLRGLRNWPWEKAKAILKSEADKWSFLAEGAPRSPYYPQVLQGATLVPRCLWFVETPRNQPVNVRAPFLRTSKAASLGAKGPWKVEVDGRVEAAFLFGTALAEDLLPFALRRLRLVVLPLMKKDRKLVMLKPDDILAEGAPLASNWIENAQKIWDRRRKEKNQSMYERLNYNRLFTNQDPQAKFIVLYNKSGTNIVAAYLPLSECKKSGDLPIEGFIADHVTYRYYADTEEHALYLVGVLNSHMVNEAIKPYQSQGLKGERDIHRRPFEVCPIPLFDPNNSLHRKIAAVASDAREEVLKWRVKIEGNAAQARQAARKLLQPELGKLNELVAELLGNERDVGVSSRRRGHRPASLFGKCED